MGTPIISSVDSDTRLFRPEVMAALDGRYPAADYATPTSWSIDAYLSPDGSYEYEVITIKARGSAINRVIEKFYDGYEKTYTPASGDFFPPSLPSLEYATDASGGYLAVNSDAFFGSRVDGVQIKEGVVYAGWGSGANDGKRGIETLVFMRDGSARAYRQSSGVTPAQIVADGGWNSFSFGPIVVENGAVRDIETGTTWGDWATTVSARTLIGKKANGDTIIVLVKGASGSSGIKGNEIGAVALRHDAVIAIMLDGGGSTQGFSNDRLFHPSTDSGGIRPVKGAIVLRSAGRGPVRVPWVDVPYASPAKVGIGSEKLQVRKDDGKVRMRGTVGLDAFTANTWFTVATLHPRFRPDSLGSFRRAVYAAGAAVTGQAVGFVSISSSDGTVQVRLNGGAGTAGSVQLDLDWEAPY